MTRKEAIKILVDGLNDNSIDMLDDEQEEALRMAIQALQADGDLISRTELLKAIDTWDRFGIDDTNSLFRLDNLSLPHYVAYIHYDDVVKCIKGMPTVAIPSAEPCEDAINRQTVKEQMIKYGFHAPDITVTEFVEDLPPVKPQPKMGHCKDCEHFQKLPYHADTIGKCVNHWGFCPKGDWYCADFVPRESEG